MTSFEFRPKNLEDMDHLLLDIKNFLKKLESGQLEIEAGQWELHKDLTNVKETIEDMRQLKTDVQEMKLSNAEAMQLIKGLENKLEAYGAVEEEPTIISENSEEYEALYNVPINNQNNTKGFKKRKCHRIVSEKIIEITSDVDSNHTKTQKKGSSEPESFPEEIKSKGCSAENKAEKTHREQKAQTSSDHSFLQKKRRTRKPDGAIMERYLNDSAKYRNRASSHSMDNKKPAINDSICTSTIRPDPVHGTFWDEERGSNSQIERNRAANSLRKITRKESILPNQFSCPRCPKSFAYKSDFSKHQKYAHENSKPKFYCRTCKKFYDKKCKLKDHLCMYLVKVKSRYSKSAAYKCCYCNKTSSSPEQLTAHLKRCRLISKGNSKRDK